MREEPREAGLDLHNEDRRGIMARWSELLD